MKRVVFFSLMLSFLVSSMSCEAQSKKAQKAATTVSNKVEVYYFHYTRRCVTCNTVEEVTKKSIAELYPEQTQKGTVNFISVNLDDANSKAIAEKCKVGGQALIVTGKDKRIDLTDKGFMFARSKPETLKEELKKAIDPLL
jgi:predicted membrane-bound dolichyl-phosphate-mannose-protein mannosyltransferase